MIINGGLLRFITYILCFVYFGGTTLVHSQQMSELVIAKNEVLTLKDSSLIVDNLVVQGVLEIADIQNVKIKVGTLDIDGGVFVAGTEDRPFGHELSLEMISKAGQTRVYNGGSLQLFGLSTPIPKNENPSQIENLETPYHNITFTVKNKNSGHLLFETDQDIHLEGVAFIGLGTTDAPALHFRGCSNSGNKLENCFFHKSKNVDLQLDNSLGDVRHNVLYSSSNSTVVSNEVLGKKGPRFIENTIYNFSSSGKFAVIMNSLNHTFTGNRVYVKGNTNGIGFLNSKMDANVPQSMATDENLVFDNNHIVQLNKILQKESLGLQVDDFPTQRLFKTSGNYIQGFSKGAVFNYPNFLAENYVFLNNTIGCIPGTAYLQNCDFTFNGARHHHDSKAIYVSDRYGTSAPKVNTVSISNYGIGIYFEGTVRQHNYFRQLKFTDTKALSFGKLNRKSVINDADGSLLQHTIMSSESSKPKKASHHEHHNVHHGHHGKHTAQSTLEATGFIIYAENSFLKHRKSEVVSEEKNIYYSPRLNTGVLTVATGLGLTDPVHEHNGTFEGISVLNENGKRLEQSDNHNRYTFEVVSDELYELDFGEKTIPFYDFGFEWEASSQKSILLKMPYPHKNPVSMRSFGNQLYAVGSLAEVKKSNISTFFWDDEKQVVYLKMVAQNNFEEMVIYASEVLTEIQLSGNKVPLAIRTDATQNTLSFAYTIPAENSYSKLEVLDYYGNVVEKVFEGHLGPNLNTFKIDLDDYDFKNNVYRYALTVNETVHRGPLHVY
ncbi:MAG: G8 domain-containing protein [Bacteroidota bacterium]